MGANSHSVSNEDQKYVQDISLTTLDDPWRIANPIYKEVIPRALTYAMQTSFANSSVNCVNPDGSLNTHKLIAGFQAFFRQNSGRWPECHNYNEAGAQLVRQAYLQGAINGRGWTEREYGLGRRRVDLMIFWRQGEKQTRVVIECKIMRKDLARTLLEGLPQTADYMDIGTATEGLLAIFDRSEERDW